MSIMGPACNIKSLLYFAFIWAGGGGHTWLWSRDILDLCSEVTSVGVQGNFLVLAIQTAKQLHGCLSKTLLYHLNLWMKKRHTWWGGPWLGLWEWVKDSPQTTLNLALLCALDPFRSPFPPCEMEISSYLSVHNHGEVKAVPLSKLRLRVRMRIQQWNPC